MKKIMLNGQWELSNNDIGQEEFPTEPWIPAVVPGDVHMDLINAGIIPEPLVGKNAEQCLWVEEKQWWYRKRFFAEEGYKTDKVELVCEGLDLTAEIWLNGEWIGRSNNMFVTHRFDISRFLRAGENEVRIRLDVGLNSISGKPLAPYEKSWNADELKRVWLRKAQFVFAWDWAPRLATCGIWRDIYIESFETAALRNLFVTSKLQGGKASIHIDAEVETFLDDCDLLDATVYFNDDQISLHKSARIRVQKGFSRVSFTMEIDRPKLWWPNGMGEAHLYHVTVELQTPPGYMLDTKTLKHGIRSATIVEETINNKENTFTFVINDVKVFSKGANWVPADSILARVSAEKYRRLITLAQQANFNMLRIWGGGIYEDEAFYDACDELGILVWQDFMYACAYYPDNDPEFCEEARREAVSIVKRLRNRASIVLWSGNNENQLMYHGHKDSDPSAVFYGEKLFQNILREVCTELDPTRPYLDGSPFGGDHPNSPDEGDQHVWEYSLGIASNSPKALKFWDYTEDNHKFISEFGILSPANVTSVKKYMGGHLIDRESGVWKFHSNTFDLQFINGMIDQYYKDPTMLALEEYTLAGQMIQAEALKHILEEWRSRMFVCSGALLWMYNDCWGTSGWTPVDYYLALKPSYFYMKRAFQPLHVVFKSNGTDIQVLNDTLDTVEAKVEYGCMSFDGQRFIKKTTLVHIPPCSSVWAASLSKELQSIEDRSRVFTYAKLNVGGQIVSRNRSFLVPFKELSIPAASVVHSSRQTDSGSWEITLHSKSFAWMVMVTFEAEDNNLSDNAFDLWPGEEKTIQVYSASQLEQLDISIHCMRS